jgi:hypothetical protein
MYGSIDWEYLKNRGVKFEVLIEIEEAKKFGVKKDA